MVIKLKTGAMCEEVQEEEEVGETIKIFMLILTKNIIFSNKKY